MSTRTFGQRIPRNEDPRLLTGQALFVDDVHLPRMAHAAFVRSPYAHARITAIDKGDAMDKEGVLAVLTAEDLGDYWQPGPLLVPPPPIERCTFHPRMQVPLAKDKVRQLGEPVVLVVATSRYLAEDVAEEIWVDYEPLPAVVELEAALAPDAPLVHEDLESNAAAHVIQEKGDWEVAREAADLVVERRFTYDRGTAAAMENRGVVADWDRRSQRLTIWDTTQAPIPIRNGLAGMLGLSENQVRVIAPFIGGGFGPKIMMFYPEEVLIPWVAMKLGQPVKWIEDRQENFTATTQERGQLHDSAMALNRDGRILGVKDVFLHDAGAYNPYGLTVPINSQCTLLGCYDVPNYYSEFTAVYTTKPIVTPYRGAGRQHGVFVMERLLDLAARELSIDRAEIRRRNFLQPDSFPHNHQIIYQDFEPLIYDSGNYEPALDRALEMIGYERFLNEEQPRLRAKGKAVGLGIVSYVEGTGIGPYEGARVQVQASGKVSVVTGVGTQGQGHMTSYAQIGGGGRCRSGDRRYRSVPLGSGHLRQPRSGGRRQRHQRGGQRCAGEDPAPRGERAGGVARGPRVDRRRGSGARCAQQSDRPGRASPARQPDARRRQAGDRAGARSDQLLRPRARRHRQWNPRHDRRGRPRDDAGGNTALRRRPRLRRGDQPPVARRPNPRSTKSWSTTKAAS